MLAVAILASPFWITAIKKKMQPQLEARKHKRLGAINAKRLAYQTLLICSCGCGKRADPKTDIYDKKYDRWWRHQCYEKFIN